jgi:hypothetical protein
VLFALAWAGCGASPPALVPPATDADAPAVATLAPREVAPHADPPEPPPFHRRVGYYGAVVELTLEPSGMALHVRNSSEGHLGIPYDQTDGTLTFPEPMAEVFNFGVGLVLRARSGRLYGTGGARPGPGYELAPIPPPGPVELLPFDGGYACALVRDDLECWPESASPLRGGGVRAVVAIARGHQPCIATARGRLYCADCTRRPCGPLRRIADDVDELTSLDGVTCMVRGPERTWYCEHGRTFESLGVHHVTSIAVGELTECAIGRRRADGPPWLYCRGAARSLGWLSVGPHGVDPATSPDSIFLVARPRPVIPVAEGARVHILGALVCVENPDGAVACDPYVHQTPLPALYGVGTLPVSTRAYVSREDLTAAVVDE